MHCWFMIQGLHENRADFPTVMTISSVCHVHIIGNHSSKTDESSGDPKGLKLIKKPSVKTESPFFNQLFQRIIQLFNLFSVNLIKINSIS